MFWKILRFELHYKFKQAFTYIFWLLLFVQGIWYLQSTESFYSTGAKSVINSGANFYIILCSLGMIGIVLASINTSSALYKDVENSMASIVYTSQVTEGQLFWARFAGAVISNFFIFTGYLVGAIALPYLGFPGNYGPVPWTQIGYGTLVFLIPALFSMVCMAFAATVFVRHSAGAYFAAFLYMAGMVFAESNRDTAMNFDLLVLLDPFGLAYILDKVTSLGALERNSFILPIEPVLVQSRLLWTVIPFIFVLLARRCFSFRYFMSKSSKRSNEIPVIDISPVKTTLSGISIPKVSLKFSLGSHIKRMFRLAWLETKTVITSWSFLLVSLIILLMFMGYNLVWTEEYYSTTSQLPLTYIMTYIRQPVGFILMIIIIVYAGETFFKDRTSNMWQITDSLPNPTWVSLLSRFVAMTLVCAGLASWFIVAGVIAQIARGFYGFDWHLYVTDIYLLTLPKYMIVVALSLFVGSLVNNKYVGHTVAIAFYIFSVVVHELEITDQSRFQFTFTPGYLYSEMNRHGHYILSEYWFILYWGALAAAMIVAGVLLWNRGVITQLRKRFWVSLSKQNRLTYGLFSLFIVGFFSCNWVIYKNVNTINNFRSNDEENAEDAAYEKKYKQYESSPQPKITELDLKLDLYPSEREAKYSVAVCLKNKTNQRIDTLHVEYKKYSEIVSIVELKKDLKLLEADTGFRHNIYKLEKPLAFGDSLILHFNMRMKYEGFAEQTVDQTDLVYNGSFLATDILPFFGYDDDREVEDNLDRLRNGLTEKIRRLPSQGSTLAVNNNYISTQAGKIAYNITIGTDGDQIALAPGNLVNEWKEGERNYSQYRSEGNGLYNFHITSASYAVQKSTWKNTDKQSVTVEIYYHPEHTWNIDFFEETAKDMLSFCSKRLGKYPYSILRIVEIPRYTNHHFAFDNTICIPEDHGWAADNQRSKDIDYIHYLLSELISQQWFMHAGMQKAQGFPMVTQSLSAYVALSMFEDKYGTEMVQNHLKKRIDNYIKGRGKEANIEPTLSLADESDYVASDKGGLVLFALSKLMGKNKLDNYIHSFIDIASQVRNPPFLAPGNFYSGLKTIVPDSLQMLLTDLFERRMFYDNSIANAHTQSVNNRYQTKVVIDCKKMYDKYGDGLLSPATKLNEMLPIQLMDKKGVVICNGFYTITLPLQMLVITTDEKPEKVMVDGFHWFIDKNLANNTSICK